jgi:hypothetical protein
VNIDCDWAAAGRTRTAAANTNAFFIPVSPLFEAFDLGKTLRTAFECNYITAFRRLSPNEP